MLFDLANHDHPLRLHRMKMAQQLLIVFSIVMIQYLDKD